MQAGILNRYIDIDKPSGAVDALNMPVQGEAGWTLHKSKWANVKTPTGMASIRSSQEGVDTALNAYSFRVRFDTSINDAMRIRMSGVAFRIVGGGVKHDYAGQQWTDIVAVSGANDG